MSKKEDIGKYYQGTGFTLLALLLWGGACVFRPEISFNFNVFLGIFISVFIIETATNTLGIWFAKAEASK